jgi:hypothetical protein
MPSEDSAATEALARARMLAARKRDPLWQVITLLGSLKLALVLLATIAVAIAAATFTEARFDSAVAKAWIYKAPWFLAWLGLLCVNLFAVTLTRWPWQRKHVGFVITHYGIILLLAGAVVGMTCGFEGNVTLRTDGSPQRKIVTDRSCLQVESPADSYLYLMPLETRFLKVSESSPKFLSVPGTPLRIGIDAVSEHLVKEPSLATAPEGTKVGPVVLLRFSSGMMHQAMALALGSSEGAPATDGFFGRALISWSGNPSVWPDHPEGGKKPWLDLRPGSSPGKVAYRKGRGTVADATGELGKEETLRLGWADWVMELRETKDNGVIASTPVPAAEGGVPGFRAFLQDPDGSRTHPLWVVSGEVVPLVLEKEIVRVGYGLELKPVPFSIALSSFEVPRDEGTETPSDFRASVLFRDLKTGREKEGKIHMNHPASYPGGLWANLTGLNYKFSQAEWNPDDLKETTLQVLYDPGWLLKWIGSLAICAGIATMFYLRPRS